MTHISPIARRAVLTALACAALAVAGCGGSSGATTTTAVPAQTSTSDAPATLDATQTASLDAASKDFVAAASRFLVRVNRCAASAHRKGCVRTAADSAEKVVTRTRDAISALARRVGGGCATQLGDVRAKIGDVTDVLSPMAEAMQKGDLRTAGQLGTNAEITLRNFATASQIVLRAC